MSKYDPYQAMLEARRGRNFEYWNDKKHGALLGKGWSIDQTLTSVLCAIDRVTELRNTGNHARIVCGYEKTIQRIKHYTIITKQKR